jgi:hypothetical protein
VSDAIAFVLRLLFLPVVASVTASASVTIVLRTGEGAECGAFREAGGDLRGRRAKEAECAALFRPTLAATGRGAVEKSDNGFMENSHL